MFDNTKVLTTGRMRETCDKYGIQIITSVTYSPSSKFIVERLVGVATDGTRPMLWHSGLSGRFWAEEMMTFMYLRNRNLTAADDGQAPYELFYGIKPDVGRILRLCSQGHATLGDDGKVVQPGGDGMATGYRYEGACGFPKWA
jgi:hypothetical protein